MTQVSEGSGKLLLQKIERLEKQNDRLKAATAGLLLVTGIVILTGRASLTSGYQSKAPEVQSNEHPRPEYLSAVKGGMPIDGVIAGLNEHYTLQKIAVGESVETWFVSAKDQTPPETGTIIAQKGLVMSVTQYLKSASTAEDEVSLVRTLYRELFANTEPVKLEGEWAPVGKIMDARGATAWLGVESYHMPSEDSQRVHLIVGGFDYSLCLTVPDHGSAYVELSKN